MHHNSVLFVSLYINTTTYIHLFSFIYQRLLISSLIPENEDGSVYHSRRMESLFSFLMCTMCTIPHIHVCYPLDFLSYIYFVHSFYSCIQIDGDFFLYICLYQSIFCIHDLFSRNVRINGNNIWSDQSPRFFFFFFRSCSNSSR